MFLPFYHFYGLQTFLLNLKGKNVYKCFFCNSCLFLPIQKEHITMIWTSEVKVKKYKAEGKMEEEQAPLRQGRAQVFPEERSSNGFLALPSLYANYHHRTPFTTSYVLHIKHNTEYLLNLKNVYIPTFLSHWKQLLFLMPAHFYTSLRGLMTDDDHDDDFVGRSRNLWNK